MLLTSQNRREHAPGGRHCSTLLLSVVTSKTRAVCLIRSSSMPLNLSEQASPLDGDDHRARMEVADPPA